MYKECDNDNQGRSQRGGHGWMSPPVMDWKKNLALELQTDDCFATGVTRQRLLKPKENVQFQRWFFEKFSGGIAPRKFSKNQRWNCTFSFGFSNVWRMTPVAKQSSVCNSGAKKFFQSMTGGDIHPCPPSGYAPECCLKSKWNMFSRAWL